MQILSVVLDCSFQGLAHQKDGIEQAQGQKRDGDTHHHDYNRFYQSHKVIDFTVGPPLERIGDLAEKLGRFELELIDEGSTSTEYAKLEHLGTLVSKLLNRSLNAFARMDAEAALKAIKKDKKVNAEYDALMRQLITRMMEDPRNIKNVLRVTWCARSLERIGDHSRNICEYVLFLVYGKDMRHTAYKDMKNQIDQITQD